MPNIGKTSEGSDTTTCSSRQSATWGETTLGSGFADSISTRLFFTNATPSQGKITCALFEYISDTNAGNKIAETEEIDTEGTEEHKWVTANFSDPKPFISNNTKYFIAVLGLTTAGTITQHANGSTAGYSIYMTRTYGDGFEDPWENESASTFHRDIYCTYTTSEGYTAYLTPVGSATHWVWNSGQYNITSGMSMYYIPWYDNNFPYRRKITINSSYVAGSHPDIPILITPSGLTGVAEDGTDIIFTNTNNIERLHHEIDTFSKGTGNIWVRVPDLSQYSDKDIYIYYGDGNDHTDDAGYLPSGTWNNEFIYVNHMNDVDDSTTKDSSRWNNTPHKRSANEPEMVKFGVGSGQKYVATDDTMIFSIAIPAYAVTSQMTMMMTFSYDLTPHDYGMLWNYGEGSDWDIYTCYVGGGSNPYAIRSFITTVDDGHQGNSNFPNLPSDNRTHYLVMTYNSKTGTNDHGLFTYYLSGKTAYSHNEFWQGDVAIGTSGLCIGNRDNTYRSFSGSIDEVRWLNKEKSHDWVSTTYSSQAHPDLFYTLGSEEATYTEVKRTFKWGVISSAANFYYPSGSPTKWSWVSGSAYI